MFDPTSADHQTSSIPINMSSPAPTASPSSSASPSREPSPAPEDPASPPEPVVPVTIIVEHEAEDEDMKPATMKQEVDASAATPSAEGEKEKNYLDSIARLPVFVPTPDSVVDGMYLTSEVPLNKAGYCYTPCAPSLTPSPSALHPFLRNIPTLAPLPTPEPEDASSNAPLSVQPIHFSFSDRSPYLRISQSALQVSAPTGFRSVRSNLPVREGSYYCEMIIERGVASSLGSDGRPEVNPGEVQSKALDGPHVRIGFGRREATLSGPVGLDGYSYGVRDKTGEKVTLSKPKKYLEEGFKTGDVVGMWIYLPPCDSEIRTTADSFVSSNRRPTVLRNRIPIRYKSQLYFESLDPPIPKEMEILMDDSPPANSTANASSSHPSTSASNHPSKKKKPLIIANQTLPSVDSHLDLSSGIPLRPLPTIKGSKIAFFVNGKSPGVAFEDLYDFRSLKEETKKRRGGAARKGGEIGLDDGWLGYFAMVSCYGGGRVKISPGPEWIYPPDFSNFDPLPPSVKEEPSDGSLPSDSIASTSQLADNTPSSTSTLAFEPLSALPLRHQPYQDSLDDADEALFLETYDPSVPSSTNPTVLAAAAARRKSAEEATLSAAFGGKTGSGAGAAVKKKRAPAASGGSGSTAGAAKGKSKLGTMGDGVKKGDRGGSGSTTPGLVWADEEEKVSKPKAKREPRPLYKTSEAMDVDSDGVYRGGGILGIGSSRAGNPSFQYHQPPSHSATAPQQNSQLYPHSPQHNHHPQQQLSHSHHQQHILSPNNQYPQQHSPHSQQQRQSPSSQHHSHQNPHQNQQHLHPNQQRPPPQPVARPSGGLERATDFLTQHLLSALPPSNNPGPSSFSSSFSSSFASRGQRPQPQSTSPAAHTSFSSRFSRPPPPPPQASSFSMADLGIDPPASFLNQHQHQQQQSSLPFDPISSALSIGNQRTHNSSFSQSSTVAGGYQFGNTAIPLPMSVSSTIFAPPPELSPTDPRSFANPSSSQPAPQRSFSNSYASSSHSAQQAQRRQQHQAYPPQAQPQPSTTSNGFAASYGMQQQQGTAAEPSPMQYGEEDAEGEEYDEAEVAAAMGSMTGIQSASGGES